MVTCSFRDIGFECTDEVSALGSFCSEDVFIVLTEVGLNWKPCINLAQSFSICSGHKNEFLKKNSVRARRTLCQIPSLVSSHTDVDHTISKDQDAKVAPRCSKNRKLASRGLKASDVLHLIRTSGMTLPVNSPCCTYCLKKLRQDFCGNSCSICASDTCITEPQNILSTATSQFPDENLWCDEEQATESTVPKKQKLHSPSLSCLHQSDSTQGQSEERFFPSQSTEPVTITDESSQDFFSQGIETMMKSVKYKVSVVEFTSQKTTVKGITAIGSYSNFSFEEGGIRVWKAFGVGEGLLIKKDQIPTIEAKELTVLKGPEDIQFHQLPRNNVQIDKENTPIQCTNDGCTDKFANEKELLHHQFVGKCHFEIEFKSSANSDITKKKYFEKLSESSFLRGVLNLSAETKQSAGEENNMTIGWALKTERK